MKLKEYQTRLNYESLVTSNDFIIYQENIPHDKPFGLGIDNNHEGIELIEQKQVNKQSPSFIASAFCGCPIQ